MNGKHITDANLEAVRKHERANADDRKRRIWQSLKTLANWTTACCILLALGYDLLNRLIGRR